MYAGGEGCGGQSAFFFVVLFHACLFDTGFFIFLFAKVPTATRGAATPFCLRLAPV